MAGHGAGIEFIRSHRNRLMVEWKFGRVRLSKARTGQLITGKGRKERGSRARLNFHASFFAMCLSHRAWHSHIISGLKLDYVSLSGSSESFSLFPRPPSDSFPRRVKDLNSFSRHGRPLLAAQTSFIYLAGQEAVNTAGSPAVTN